MDTTPHSLVPIRRAGGRALSAALLASGLLVMSFPVDAAGHRGGGGGGSSTGGGGSRGSSFSGGGRSYSGGSRSYSGGSYGGRSYASSAPRSSSSGGRSWSAWARSSSEQVRTTSGDRSSSSPGPFTSSGPRTYTAGGVRGGQGGPPPGGGSGGGHPGGNPGGGAGAPPPGGHSGGGHPGGGSHGGHYGGHRGWYCPPTYYSGSSWFWGGPWNWWWGWGTGWGWGWGGPWGPYVGGVYVITDTDGVLLGNQYARIDTDVSPEAAEVYLDATLIGQADDFDGYPDYLYLAPGKYRLEFRHPFYETIVKDLDVRAGQSIQVNDEMKLLPGKKKLEVVDPESRGTPLGRVFGKPEEARGAGRASRTGRYEVTGEPDSTSLDGIDAIDAIDVGEGAMPPKPPAPPAEPAWRSGDTAPGDVAPASQGRLRFDVEPDDAAVYVDDRYVGTAEELGALRRGLRVKPGKHTVTVVRPGYASKTVEVESKDGAAVDVVVELEK